MPSLALPLGCDPNSVELRRDREAAGDVHRGEEDREEGADDLPTRDRSAELQEPTDDDDA